MPTKAELYAQMADKVATQLTGSWQEWAGFLTTASRLYKYPFHEQLMIYAQRPDATACAEYDLWNEKMGRYVRRCAFTIPVAAPDWSTACVRYAASYHRRKRNWGSWPTAPLRSSVRWPMRTLPSWSCTRILTSKFIVPGWHSERNCSMGRRFLSILYKIPLYLEGWMNYNVSNKSEFGRCLWRSFWMI